MTIESRSIPVSKLDSNFEAQTINAYTKPALAASQVCDLMGVEFATSKRRQLSSLAGRQLCLRVSAEDAISEKPAYRFLQCGKRCVARFVPQ